MNSTLGQVGLVIALACSAAAIGTLGVGVRRGSDGLYLQGRYLLVASFAGLLLSTFAMERAFITHDFSIAYVAANNSRETPLLFSITGMWSSLSGSILLWAVVLGGFVVAMVVVTRSSRDRRTEAWALIIAGAILLFFLLLLVGPANPFLQGHLPFPVDGKGPDPLLQNYPLVAIHPPLLYTGFVGMTVPFAFFAASLITSTDEAYWLHKTRNWSLVAWMALTAGITLGAWWSYQVLGWGGFWSWDPVENSALMPWLCATAFLHSATARHRRGSMRLWNFSLVAAAFSLTILGTYFTRSGVLQSVHAFSASNLGWVLIGFFVVVVLFCVVLVWIRADTLRGGAVGLGLDKASAILLNNFLFAGFTFVILLGTSFPLFEQLISPQTVSVGSPFFDTFGAPIGVAMLFFMAVSPLVPWKGTSRSDMLLKVQLPALAGAVVIAGSVIGGETRPFVLAIWGVAAFAIVAVLGKLLENIRNRNGAVSSALLSRRNGGLIVHFGVVLVAVALASATTFGQQGELRLSPGQSSLIFGQRITYLGVQTVVTPAESALEANVLVGGRGPYHPAIAQFGTYTQAVGSPSVNVQLFRDVYLTVDATPNPKNPTSKITLGVIVQPLISWLWGGALVMVLGALLAGFGAGGGTSRRRRGAQDAGDDSRRSVAPQTDIEAEMVS